MWTPTPRIVVCAFSGTLTGLLGCGHPRKPPADMVTRAWEEPTPPPNNEPVEFSAPIAEPPGFAADSPATTDPASEAAAPAIAYVNGLPIGRQRVADILIDAFGLEVVELLIRLELARELASSMGIDVSPADVRAEYESALRRISSPVLGSQEDNFDREAAERVLDNMRLRNGVSKTQFMIKIEHDAYLRKVAERDVVVDDSMLSTEHERAYGERVRVRHIQLNTLEEVSAVRAQLKAGVDFELLVGKFSRNEVTAAADGLLPAFSQYDDVPPLLCKAAFELEPGEISNAIFENGSYHLIRVERRFPPTAVSVDLVRDELRTRIRRRLIEQRMRQLAADLFDEARIEITDRALLRRFREKYPNARVYAP